MAQQQWGAPYGWVPFHQNPGAPAAAAGAGAAGSGGSQPMFMLSPMTAMGTPMMVMTPPNHHGSHSVLSRPHSVAFGSPPQPPPPGAMYPIINFNWQRGMSQQPQQMHQRQLMQQPDVTAQEHHESGLLFRPDLVANSSDFAQPTYSNEGQEQQPCYINTLDHRETRGVSMPPVIESSQWAPKPPPRSKRASRMGSRSSLADSNNGNIDVKELTQKLQTLETIADQPPIRPPRRKKSRSQLNNSATLPRDFALQSIAEYEMPPSTALDHESQSTSRPSIPQPGAGESGLGQPPETKVAASKPEIETPQSATKPSIPQPAGIVSRVSSECAVADLKMPISTVEGNSNPVVPMPNIADELFVPTQEIIDYLVPTIEQPSIPQPNPATISPEIFLTETGSKFDFSITVPMPKSNTSRKSSDASGGSRSSAQSIRDEIIDGLHQMGSNVKILKQGVHKIYEDLKPVPTYASPNKKGQQNKQTISAADDEAKEVNTAVEDEENPYETLSVKENNNVINASESESESNCYDIQNDFRATFFGIAKDEDTNSSSNNSSEEGGDVTPTELRPEILIEVEKEEIIEEVENREKSPADHKLAGTGRTAAEDSALSSETEEVLSDTETIDVSLDGLDANSLAGSKTDKIASLNNRDYDDDDDDVVEEEAEDHDIKDDYDTLMFKAQYIC